MSASSSRSIQQILSRATNPAILPIPPRTTGNNVPKSLHKTRRTWLPNTVRYNLPTNVLGDGEGQVLSRVKMQSRRIKDVEKAGGVEGLLLSRASKDLTPFGRRLRSELFRELHDAKISLEALRRNKQVEGGAAASVPLVE
ncbi:large subunit ribosomal protein L28, partial [Tremellales sp. Uapishka_1]